MTGANYYCPNCKVCVCFFCMTTKTLGKTACAKCGGKLK
jgi:hypothetical protein